MIHFLMLKMIFKFYGSFYDCIDIKMSVICFCGRKVEEDLSNELELQIKGAEKPSIWGLLGIRFILLPYATGKVCIC